MSSLDIDTSDIDTSDIDTSDVDTAAADSSGGWTVWQWAMVALFVALAFLATLVVRKRMEASARARSGDGQ